MRWRLLACVGVLCAIAANAPAALAEREPETLGFTFSPGSGPPGTRVHFEGDVPLDALDFSTYQMPGSGYGLEALDVPTNPADCNLIVPFRQERNTVTADGHATGSFVIDSKGGCFMSDSDLGPQPARPGVYGVLLSCHACALAGTFTITSPTLARTGTRTVPLAAIGAGLSAIGLFLVALASGLHRRAS